MGQSVAGNYATANCASNRCGCGDKQDEEYEILYQSNNSFGNQDLHLKMPTIPEATQEGLEESIHENE